MKLSILFLSLIVILAIFLTGSESAVARNGRRDSRGRLTQVRGRQTERVGGWRGRQQRRKGRQEEEEAPADEEGAEIHNGCDHATNIGAFLNYLRFKKFCVEKEVTDFGPYGGVPAEGSGEGDEEGGVIVEVA